MEENRDIKAHTNQLIPRWSDENFSLEPETHLPCISPQQVTESNDLDSSNIDQDESLSSDLFESFHENPETEDDEPLQIPQPRPQRSTAGRPPGYLKDYIHSVVNEYIL